jgi:NSS family neurotransmitter:Na+ symporter
MLHQTLIFLFKILSIRFLHKKACILLILFYKIDPRFKIIVKEISMSTKPASPVKATLTRWSTRWAFIWATAGAAVGLGNVWKFPYMAGMNGGGAFVLVYLGWVAVIGIPLMMAEAVIGRLGRRNAIDSMSFLAVNHGHSAAWGLVGAWGALTMLLVLSFYSVVAGWSLAYLIHAAIGAFNGASPADIGTLWGGFLASPVQQISWHSIFIFMTIIVVACGVQKGLEPVSRFLMPGLLIILFVLVGYACLNGDAIKAIHFLFTFDFQKLTAEAILGALGQAFFSLALGAGMLVVYTAYVPGKTHLASTLSIVAVIDALVALLAGMAIFPLVFSHGLVPEGGPGLMFVVLPVAFSSMPAGQFIGALFFLLLFFAALTSSISMLEPIVAIVNQRFPISRKIASFIVGAIAWLIGIGCALSFNLWKDFHPIADKTFFDLIADTASNWMLPIGGILFAIFAGWKISKRAIQNALPLHDRAVFRIWFFIVRFVAPIAILVVLFNSVL